MGLRSTKTKKILCYGDSNTWGYIPGSEGERFDVNERWTGVMQNKLGGDFEIIEAGLCGRTTNLDDPILGEYKNGKRDLKTMIEMNNPLDIIIISLGTNDCKNSYNREPKEIAEAIAELVIECKRFSWNKEMSSAKIIVTSPAIIREDVKNTDEEFIGTKNKSKQLYYQIQTICQNANVDLINLAEIAESSEIDGIHFEKEAHEKVGKRIKDFI